MDYFDEEILENKRELERQKHTTLETGIYADEELITFTERTLPETTIHLLLPDQFIPMPKIVKKVKYPSIEAPAYIITSLDSTVNIGFNLLPILLQEGDIQGMCTQFLNALKNTNPSISIKNQTDVKTVKGNEISWFEYKGYHLDGQSFNRTYLVKMRKTVLHGIFNCQFKDREKWSNIIEKCFMSIEEKL